MIIEKYSNEINDVKEKLSKINDFKFDSINIYGSAANEDMFVENVSDIDMIIMCKDFSNFNKQDIIRQLNEMKIDFKEKRPIVLKDSLCERIEFYIVYDRINIDITICPGLIPSRKSLERDAWYDGFEALMGGVYIGSKSIYGKIPDYDLFMSNYYPFYDDDLKIKRLDILAKRLSSYNERIRGYLKNSSPEMIDHVFKVKKFFIKFLYISNNKYFWTPEKHTYYQLTKILNLPEEEKRIICFMDGNFKSAATRFIDYSESHIDNYNKVLRKQIRG